MTAVTVLPTAAARPLPAQRIRGAVPRGVVPAYKLTNLRRDKSLLAARTAEQEAAIRHERQRKLANALHELRTEALNGAIDGLVFVVRLTDGDERVDALGSYQAAEELATLQNMGEVLARVQDMIDEATSE